MSDASSVAPVIEFLLFVAGPQKRQYLKDEDDLSPGDKERHSRFKTQVSYLETNVATPNMRIKNLQRGFSLTFMQNAYF